MSVLIPSLPPFVVSVIRNVEILLAADALVRLRCPFSKRAPPILLLENGILTQKAHQMFAATEDQSPKSKAQ